MSYMKRHIEDEILRLSEEYGYSEEYLYDAMEFTEYDWDRVELLCRARVLNMFVNVHRAMQVIQRNHDKKINRALEEAKYRIE